MPVFTLVPGFYAEDLGLGLAMTGLMLFFSRTLDLSTDPLVGWHSDRGGPGRRSLVLIGIRSLAGVPYPRWYISTDLLPRNVRTVS